MTHSLEVSMKKQKKGLTYSTVTECSPTDVLVCHLNYSSVVLYLRFRVSYRYTIEKMCI